MAKKRDVEFQLEELQAQVQDLQQQLKKYRDKEAAIVQALTDAQTTSSKRILETEQAVKGILHKAEAQAKSTVGEAEARAAAITRGAEQQAMGTIADAQQRAKELQVEVELQKRDVDRISARVQSEAEEEARQTLTEARAMAHSIHKDAAENHAEFKNRLQMFTEMLGQNIESARAQAEAYQTRMKEVLDRTQHLKVQSEELDTLLEESKAALPENYESPSALMHGIYQLQRRDLPEHVAGAQPEEEETVVAEASAEVVEEGEAAGSDADDLLAYMAEFAEKAANEYPSPEEEARRLIEEAPAHIPEAAPEPVVEAPQAQDAAAILTEAAPGPAPGEVSPGEERVWTVDEIISGQPAKDTVTPDDVDLDSLLDEIIGD